jgi:hypothetical protein
MNLRITALVYTVCFVALWVGLYLVKYSVEHIQRDVVAMRDHLGREKESLHLLNAEWAYLNRPDRLERLADHHLDLVPLDSKRIEEINALPAASTIDATAPESRGMYQPIHHVTEER